MIIKNSKLARIQKKAVKTKAISKNDAFFLASRQTNTWDLLHGAYIIREHFFKNKIHLCSIINAKSGNCAEDCKFCAQSARHNSVIKNYRLVSPAVIKDAYYKAKDSGAGGFSIVTSGNRLSAKEIESITGVVRELRGQSKTPYLCLSVGRLSSDNISRLKSSGLTKCHHNLETSRRFFNRICSTHSYDERVQTIQNLKKAKIQVCSGGIFGLGESWADRVDLAFTLKRLKVDSIPLNFLIPVKGTSLEKNGMLHPMEALKIIALFRFILPDTDIRICAGREKVLRDLQSLIFYAGATGMMTGGYLTQPGRKTSEDLQMLSDLELIH